MPIFKIDRRYFVLARHMLATEYKRQNMLGQIDNIMDGGFDEQPEIMVLARYIQIVHGAISRLSMETGLFMLRFDTEKEEAESAKFNALLDEVFDANEPDFSKLDGIEE